MACIRPTLLAAGIVLSNSKLNRDRTLCQSKGRQLNHDGLIADISAQGLTGRPNCIVINWLATNIRVAAINDRKWTDLMKLYEYREIVRAPQLGGQYQF